MKIVLVTGGFDPIHSGHIEYFKAAKQLGDKLVVGINSDKWLTRKKGRPFLSFEERKIVIENAVKKIFGEHIQIKFSSKQAKLNIAGKLEKEIEKKNTYPPTTQTQEIKNPNFPKDLPRKEDYENSTKNLANFFNREIIDLEE